MKQDPITRIEREVAQEQTHRDGIPQLVVGIFLIFAMLSMMSGSKTFPVFVPFVPLAIKGLRRRITYPRIGYAQIKDQRSTRLWGIWLILSVLVAGILAFLLFRGQSNPMLQSDNFHYLMMFAVAFLIVAISIVFLVKNKNTVAIWYAALILIFLIAVVYFRLHKPTVYWLVMAFGALHLLFGSYNLASFIHKYPVLKDE